MRPRGDGATKINGRISSDLDDLQALHAAVGWVPGRENIRPTPEVVERKAAMLAHLGATYICEPDFILETVFGVPMTRTWVRPEDGAALKGAEDEVWLALTEPGAAAPSAGDDVPHSAGAGPGWSESPGASAALAGIRRKAFRPNLFPYRLPRGTHHWVMWYLRPGGAPVPPAEVDADIAAGVAAAAAELAEAPASQRGDWEFAWYENPRMTIPEIYHVQVFWRLRPAAAEPSAAADGAAAAAAATEAIGVAAVPAGGAGEVVASGAAATTGSSSGLGLDSDHGHGIGGDDARSASLRAPDAAAAAAAVAAAAAAATATVTAAAVAAEAGMMGAASPTSRPARDSATLAAVSVVDRPEAGGVAVVVPLEVTQQRMALSKCSEAVRPDTAGNEVGEGGNLRGILAAQPDVVALVNGGYFYFRKADAIYAGVRPADRHVGDPFGVAKIREHVYSASSAPAAAPASAASTATSGGGGGGGGSVSAPAARAGAGAGSGAGEAASAAAAAAAEPASPPVPPEATRAAPTAEGTAAAAGATTGASSLEATDASLASPPPPPPPPAAPPRLSWSLSAAASPDSSTPRRYGYLVQRARGSPFEIVDAAELRRRGGEATHKYVLCCSPWLIVDGGRVPIEEVATAEELASVKGPPGHLGHLLAPNPRSFVGARADGSLLLAAYHGRLGAHPGLTYADLQAEAEALGCEQALNLDGGGSSQCWVEGRGVLVGNDLDRVIGNAIVLFR